MFFSKGLIYRSYDVNAIKCFYEVLSSKMPDIKLEWRKGRKVVNTPEEANLAVILRGHKMLFALSNVTDKGFINLAVAGNNERQVLDAAAEADIVSGPHSFTTGIVCLAVYLVLMFFVLFSFNSEFRAALYVCFATLFGGVALYIWALFKNQNESLLTISSIISIIGFILLAPGSLLIFPLLLAINRQWLYLKTYK